MSRPNGLISTTGSKANATGDECPQLRAAIECAPTFIILSSLSSLIPLQDKSINQSLGAYAEGRVASPTLRHQLWQSPRVSPHASSLPIPIIFSREHRLAPATNFVGAFLASSTLGYVFQKELEKQDELDKVLHAVDVGELCDRSS